MHPISSIFVFWSQTLNLIDKVVLSKMVHRKLRNSDLASSSIFIKRDLCARFEMHQNLKREDLNDMKNFPSAYLFTRRLVISNSSRLSLVFTGEELGEGSSE
ncbi:hypothetical protein Tco_0874366 [Tanacetum coccineum]|uniref:Uncharacterized protein n=1 Tax=Tanacetum coccineum TaxID=301880 RepID=A0ABQ5BLD8_9ASTR